ncbi:MAG: hypothetical protein MN733_07925 [Nitrososphaera sp.]|nr:hypothetical protein [Nitrososphaera sp.]
MNRNRSPPNDMGSGQLELEVQEAYLADKQNKIARLDRGSMKELHVSAGDAVILFADERPVILKAFSLYPSDKSDGIIRIGRTVRQQLKRDIGSSVTVRGIGNTKIDKVVNYLLLDKYSSPGE